VDLFQRIFFVEQGKVRLGAKIEIRGSLPAGFDLRDEPRCPGIHVRTCGEIDARFDAVSFIKGRLELGKAFFPAKRLSSGDKDDLFSFFLGGGDQLLRGFRCAQARNSNQKRHHTENRGPKYDTELLHLSSPINADPTAPISLSRLNGRGKGEGKNPRAPPSPSILSLRGGRGVIKLMERYEQRQLKNMFCIGANLPGTLRARDEASRFSQDPESLPRDLGR